jgi:hypothetical protein
MNSTTQLHDSGGGLLRVCDDLIVILGCPMELCVTVQFNCEALAHYFAKLRPLLTSPFGLRRTETRGFSMRIRALLITCLVVASSLIALPANAASAIQFRKIQYDPSGSDVPGN